jgi:hypothetical protein
MSKLDYRTGRNNPTPKELAARRRLVDGFKKYSEEPFPNGAKILFNGDGTPTAEYWKEWGTIEPAEEIFNFV